MAGIFVHRAIAKERNPCRALLHLVSSMTNLHTRGATAKRPAGARRQVARVTVEPLLRNMLRVKEAVCADMCTHTRFQRSRLCP